MKTSVIARVLVGTALIGYIIYSIVLGANCWITGEKSNTDSIIIKVTEIIGISLSIVISILLLGVTIVIIVRLAIETILWIFTGEWDKNWLDIN